MEHKSVEIWFSKDLMRHSTIHATFLYFQLIISGIENKKGADNNVID